MELPQDNLIKFLCLEILSNSGDISALQEEFESLDVIEA